MLGGPVGGRVEFGGLLFKTGAGFFVACELGIRIDINGLICADAIRTLP